jgi:hypothetical protein
LKFSAATFPDLLQGCEKELFLLRWSRWFLRLVLIAKKRTLSNCVWFTLDKSKVSWKNSLWQRLRAWMKVYNPVVSMWLNSALFTSGWSCLAKRKYLCNCQSSECKCCAKPNANAVSVTSSALTSWKWNSFSFLPSQRLNLSHAEIVSFWQFPCRQLQVQYWPFKLKRPFINFNQFQSSVFSVCTKCDENPSNCCQARETDSSLWCRRRNAQSLV